MIGLIVFLVLLALVTTAVAAYVTGVDFGLRSKNASVLSARLNANSRMDAATRDAMDAAHHIAHDQR